EQTVGADDLVVLLEQPVDEARAEETGAAGHKYALAAVGYWRQGRLRLTHRPENRDRSSESSMQRNNELQHPCASEGAHGAVAAVTSIAPNVLLRKLRYMGRNAWKPRASTTTSPARTGRRPARSRVPSGTGSPPR